MNSNLTLSNINILIEMGFDQHAENERCFWRGNDLRVFFIENSDEIKVERYSPFCKRWGGWRTWRCDTFGKVLDLLDNFN